MDKVPVTTEAADQARVVEVLSTTRAMRRLSSEPIPHIVLEAPVLVAAYSTSGRTGPSAYPLMWQLCLAARAENIGSVFTTLLAHLGHDQIDEILGVPTDSSFRLAGLVPLGVPLGRWGVPRRPDLSETTSRNHWAEPWGRAATDQGETP
jgi:hypothetical protein